MVAEKIIETLELDNLSDEELEKLKSQLENARDFYLLQRKVMFGSRAYFDKNVNSMMIAFGEMYHVNNLAARLVDEELKARQKQAATKAVVA